MGAFKCDGKTMQERYEKVVATKDKRIKELEDAITNLNPAYWMAQESCECDSEYPGGGCLYCGLKGLKEVSDEVNRLRQAIDDTCCSGCKQDINEAMAGKDVE